MHDPATVRQALDFLADGYNQCEVGRMLSINRRTVGDWANGRLPDFDLRSSGECNRACGELFDGPAESYVYLLGLYLGDGCLTEMPRSVYKLRITCDSKYVTLLDRCENAMRLVMPKNKVSRAIRQGCTDVYSHSKHWPCLFPQHGLGKKHDREIKLEPWQQALVDIDPRPLVEGLLHSDGCRVTNFTVNKKTGKRYEYPRYHFSNKSADIKKILTDALDALGIEWRENNRMNISIARADAIARLDTFVMPKR